MTFTPTERAELESGAEQARMFDELKADRNMVLTGYDLLIKECEDISQAGDIHQSFERVWKLLRLEHERVLNMEKQ